MQTSKEKRETFILQRKQAPALRDKLQTAEEDSPTNQNWTQWTEKGSKKPNTVR